jgi:hypothetical protein
MADPCQPAHPFPATAVGSGGLKGCQDRRYRLGKEGPAVADTRARPVAQVALLLLLLLAYRVAHDVIRCPRRAQQWLQIDPPRSLGVKLPAVAEPGLAWHGPTGKQVQVRPVPRGPPAGCQLDEGEVLERAKGRPDLGHKAGQRAAEALSERLGGALLLSPHRRWGLAPKRQGLAEGER